MKEIIKSTAVLCAITLIAGLALAGVYAVTKEPIAAAEKEARANAFRTVLADAKSFDNDEDIDARLSDKEALDALFESDGIDGVRIDGVAVAKDADGNTLGWAITVTSSSGYSGDITLAMGVTPDGVLTGISVIKQGETAGLGANCAKEDFSSQFAEVSADKVTYTKNGASAEGEIDAISGATVTTSAVVDAVNAGLLFARTHLLEGGAD